MLSEVDVIIPTFNRLEELKKTLKILCVLGFKENQIFIVDDNSPDGTYQYIKDNFPEVNIDSNKTSKGVIYSRNLLWKKVSKPFVLSLDDDSAPASVDTISEAISVLKNNPQVGVLAFNILEGTQIDSPPACSEKVREVRMFTACGCLFSRGFIKENGFYALEKLHFHGEELDCSIRGYQKGYKIVTKDNLFVNHRADWGKRNKKIFGKYGKIWRSANGFSANLIIAAIYYPYLIDFVFIFLYISKRFWTFFIRKGHVLGFIAGIVRFLKFLPFVFSVKNKMSYRLFRYWISLPMK